MANLLDRLATDDETVVRGLIAEVASVSGRFVTLTVRGASVPGVRTAASYASPTAGDVVFVARLGSAWIALARLN